MLPNRNHSTRMARQRAMLDLVASHGYLMGQSLAREQQRQSLLDEAEQMRRLKAVGVVPSRAAFPLARWRRSAGLALIRAGIWLGGQAPARQTAQPAR